jgi:dihydropteroate synthase
MASVAAAILKGANIVRVHDVKETVEFVRVLDAIRQF